MCIGNAFLNSKWRNYNEKSNLMMISMLAFLLSSAEKPLLRAGIFTGANRLKRVDTPSVPDILKPDGNI